MNFHVMTLFPEMIEQAMSHSITGRAIKAGLIRVDAVNIRDYSDNKHNRVDDYPYGGGAGMVMQAEPVYGCYEAICERIGAKPRVLFMSPQGRVFHQEMARELSQEEDLIFLCGHYEGIDQRVLDEIVTDYVSIGDFVLTGGELPALVMMDTISRLVPGVLHNDMSAVTESFTHSLLEHPQYTRPEVWHDQHVPAVLLSGHHKNLEAWYRQESIRATMLHRPDLLEGAGLTPKEWEMVRQWREQEEDGKDADEEA